MSLLMDALKKAEQAKQGELDADTPSRPAALEAAAIQSEDEKVAIPSRHADATASLELTMDEPEPYSEPERVDTAADEPAPRAKVQPDKQEEPEADLSLPADSSTPVIEQQKMAHEPGPVAEPLQPATARTVAEEQPAADPLQLQRTFALKSQAVARRKRLLLLTFGGVVLVSLLGGGYYYVDHAISSLGSSSLVAADNVGYQASEQDIAGSADVMADELDSSDSPTQGVQDDNGAVSMQAKAPLQTSASAAQTVSTQQSLQVPVSEIPLADDHVAAAVVRKPTGAGRSAPVSNKPLQQKPISIQRTQKIDTINERLLEAYHAYQAGNYMLASRSYHDVLQQDALNRDALLGLATIAHRNGDRQQAADYYITLLKHNPRDSTAISGLVTLHGAGLKVENESRIKLLLDQEPESAHLHFALGTLYAGQSRWADAQQSYFNAHRYAPQNADYAYNLAVSLDRIGKQTTALQYYRRAVLLAGEQQAMFNLSEAKQRINTLLGLTNPIR